MKKDEFNQYLINLKNSIGNIHMFKNTSTPYFYVNDTKVSSLLLEMHKSQMIVDTLFNSFNDIQKQMIKQSFFIDEVQSTNETENIYSTRNDILEIMKDARIIQNKKIISIVHAYNSLDVFEPATNLKELRFLYEYLMENAYESKKDKPDGDYFRKGPVFVSDGIKKVHDGFYPEQNIIEGMKEYLNLLLDTNLDIYLRIILGHFMIETIHPYYDGNGRYGRYLMSLELNNHNQTIFSYVLATAINKQKKKYYSTLENARDIHQFGCVNMYVSEMCQIFLTELKNVIQELTFKKEKTGNIQTMISLTKSEKKIYDLLYQASILSYFGLSNEEILNHLQISKRTLISSLQKFREQNLLIEYKLGKITYHRLKIN